MGAGGLGARRRTMEDRRRRLFSPAERSANAARCAIRCRFSLLMALVQISGASRNFWWKKRASHLEPEERAAS
eukprot:3977016-Pyramimonas_sp.AAC.1